MKAITSFAIAAVAAASAMASLARAALVVQAEHVTVVPEPLGGNTVYGFFDVFVRNDVPTLKIGGFQLQITLPEFQRDVVFATNGITNTTARPALLPGEPFFSSIDSVRLRTIKTTLNPADLLDNGGLARIEFAVAPGIEGEFPVEIVTLAMDQDFGTAVLAGNYSQLPYAPVNGLITVRIPEPMAGTLLAGMAALALRRRK